MPSDASTTGTFDGVDRHLPNRVVVGVSGASGAPYAVRVLEMLAVAGVEIHLVVTALGRRLLQEEAGLGRLDADRLTGGRADQLIIHASSDVGAPIASGSFQHRGMIVVPASSNTLGAIAAGTTSNLLQRAAAVTLKERRRLVLAHRESPLSMIDIESMRRVTEAGGIIAPLSPGFYLEPKTIDDLVDFCAGRLLDLVGVRHDLPRWSEEEFGSQKRRRDADS